MEIEIFDNKKLKPIKYPSPNIVVTTKTADTAMQMGPR